MIWKKTKEFDKKILKATHTPKHIDKVNKAFPEKGLHFLDADTIISPGSKDASYDVDWAMFSSLYIYSCNVLPESIKVELSLAKELRVSEENLKKFIKKIPENIFRKTGHSENRGGNLTFDAEELIKNSLNEDDRVNFEENPYLKFHSGSDLA